MSKYAIAFILALGAVLTGVDSAQRSWADEPRTCPRLGGCAKSKTVIAKDASKAVDAEAERFVGRWRIIGDKGATACYFTLTDSLTAKKSHVPDCVGVWEVVGDEARITWSDGWKDILRLEKGYVAKIAFGPKTTWTDTPANTQKAIREPGK